MTQKIEILKTMFSNEGIIFEDANGWNTFARQIDVHNQSLNEMLKSNVSWDDALFSWYEILFTPLNRAITAARLRRSFPGKASGEIFLGVLAHWNRLLEKNEIISAEYAVYDFRTIYKDRKGFISRLFSSQPPHRDVPTAA